MGQSRTVLVYRLLAADTIDESIDDMLREKQAIFDAFADKSAAADATNREENQIDDKTLGKLILEEIDRINAKNGNKRPAKNAEDVIFTEEDATASVGSPSDSNEPAATGSTHSLHTETDQEGNASAKEENIHPSKNTAPPVVAFPSIDVLIDYLSSNSIEFKDNRPKNGCLWIKADELPNAKAIRVDGQRLMYSKASKALKGEAGWYIS